MMTKSTSHRSASSKGLASSASAQTGKSTNAKGAKKHRSEGSSPVGAVSSVYSRMGRVSGGDEEDQASKHLSTFASGARGATKSSAAAVKGGVRVSKAAASASKATVKGAKAAKAGAKKASDAAKRAKALKKQGKLGSTVKNAGRGKIRSLARKGKTGIKKAPKAIARNGAKFAGKGAVKGLKFGATKGIPGAYKGAAGGAGDVMSRMAGDDSAAQVAAQATDMLLKAPDGAVRLGRTAFHGAKNARKVAQTMKNAPKAARATMRAAAKAAQMVRAIAAKVAAAVASMIAAAAPMMGIVAIVGVVVGLIMSIISWLPSFIGGREQDRWDSYCMCQAAQDGAAPNREAWQTSKSNADDVIGYRDSDVDDAAVLRKLKDDYNWPLTDPAACNEHDEPEDSKSLAAEWSAASGKYLSQAQLIDADAAAVRESRQKKLGNDARKRVSDKLATARQLLTDSESKTQGNEVRQTLTDRINEAQALVDSDSYDLDRLKVMESDLQTAIDDVNASVEAKESEG